MACFCLLKVRLSGGDGLRRGLDFDKLMKVGWYVDKKGKLYVFVFFFFEERRFKFLKDVTIYF